MDLDRAKRITGWCIANKMVTMGVGDDSVPDLDGISLAELLEANHMVKADNGEKNEDGTTSMQMFCDDRLVAALYTFYNYDAESGDDIEPLVRLGDKALICIRVPEDQDG